MAFMEGMDNGPHGPEDRETEKEKPTVYIDKDGKLAYWADGRVHELTPEQMAERARRESEPGTPPQGDLPELGDAAFVDSFDEIEVKEAEAATERMAGGDGGGVADDGEEAGRDRGGRRGRGGEGGNEGPREPRELDVKDRQDAERYLAGLLNRSAIQNEARKNEFIDQIDLIRTDQDRENIRVAIVEARRGEREERNRPPEPPPPLPHPEVQGPPPPPEWAGRYAGAAPWRNFNAADYARVTPMTIQEIQNHPRYNELFGEFLIGVAPNAEELMALITRVGRGENDPATGRPLVLPNDALQLTQYAQSEFTLQMQRMEKIAQEMKPEDLRMMIARQPALKAIMDLNKAEPTTQAFIEAMFHTAARNKGGFENFNRAFAEYKEKQGTERAKNMERDIGDLCKRLNVPRENYESIIDVQDIPGTQQRLTQVIRGGKRGMWHKAMDRAEQFLALERTSLPGSSRDRAILASMRAEKIEPPQWALTSPRSWATSQITELQQQMLQGIAPTLQSAEFQQAMVRRAFALETLAPAVDRGPQTVEQMRAQLAMIDRNYAEQLFDRDLAAEAQRFGRSADSFSDQEREYFKDNVWYPPEARGTARGWSVLSMLARALQRLFLRTVGSQVRVNPAARMAAAPA